MTRYDSLPECLAGAHLATAQELYRHVFRGNETYFQPFSPAVPDKCLLPKTHGYQLSQHQFEALAMAAQKLDGASVYLCKTEPRGDTPTSRPDCWEISLNDYQAYRTAFNPLMEESLFLSRTGRWGVFISQEWFGVAGGPPEFISTLTRELQIDDSDIVAFIVDNSDGCRDISKLPWLRELIEHVYGPEKGGHLLELAGFDLSGDQ